MRFFDRTEEIASLRKIREMAKNNAQFTVVTGRRRIGKTSLVWKAEGIRGRTDSLFLCCPESRRRFV